MSKSLDAAETALAQSVTILIESVRDSRLLIQRLEDEIQEIREGLVELDHRHAATRQVLNSLQEDQA